MVVYKTPSSVYNFRIVVNRNYDDSEWVNDNANDICKLKYMDYAINQHNNVNIYIIHKSLVVGAISLHIGDRADYEFGIKNWINSISILDDYKGNGLCEQLVEAAFQWCVSNNIDTLLQSSYSKEGLEKAMHVFERIAKKYPSLNFVDKNREL